MKNIFEALFPRPAPRAFAPAPTPEPEAVAELWRLPDGAHTLHIDQLPQATSGLPSPVVSRWADGEKFPGGFGLTELITIDYWTLRARSTQLFETNFYARGILMRFVTNVINTGLALECQPFEEILGLPEDDLTDWSEEIEDRFELWSNNELRCDQRELLNFGALQKQLYLEALIDGDRLVVIRQDPETKITKIQLISGNKVRQPLLGTTEEASKRGNRIEQGVELDEDGRHVAFYVEQSGMLGETSYKRIEARGATTKRRQAWLVYGTEKRQDQVRGMPILALIIQSLREIDRYRDSVQRKALVGSMIALMVTKDQPTIGTMPLTGSGGISKTKVSETTGPDNAPRRYAVTEQMPGAILDELAVGEKVQGFSHTSTDEAFGGFEEAIIQGISWGLQVPPEIMRLAFSSNYSASQAALNEFKMFLNTARDTFAAAFCKPVYHDWMISHVLNQSIHRPGILASFSDPTQLEAQDAWLASDWTGQIKPTTDPKKQIEAQTAALEIGATDYDRAAREISGTSFRKNMKNQRKQAKVLAEVRAPLLIFEGLAPEQMAPARPEGGAAPPAKKKEKAPMTADDVSEMIASALEEFGSEKFGQAAE